MLSTEFYFAVLFSLCMRIPSCPILCDSMDYSLPDSSVHGIFSGKNTEVGCHFLPQGIFQTHRSNPMSLVSPALGGRVFTMSATWEALCYFVF